MSGADIFRQFEIFFTLLVIVPVPILGAIKNVPSIQLAAYNSVPVRYGLLNKMTIPVRVNRYPANLIVDIRVNQIVLDASMAESFGVTSSHHGLRYIGFTQING